MNVLVTLVGLVLIGDIYWFFFGKKEEHMETSDVWNIVVDGGYKPSVISVPQGKKATLTITRKDPNSCLEDFILPDFKIKKYLPLNETVTVTFTPQTTGAYGFHCGMNMYHGRIVVV